jgi:protein MpaA
MSPTDVLKKAKILLSFCLLACHKPSAQSPLPHFCRELESSIQKLHWKLQPCQGIHWQVGGYSVERRPLIYTELGNPHAKNKTLIFSMVHGDEITPLYSAIALIDLLKQKPLFQTHVIIAPLVNPDGFFKRTRTNTHGVDINRNFATQDWKPSHHNPRRNTGKHPDSEPETRFQEQLILTTSPHKILSIHAPLNFLDYDGPGTIPIPLPKDYIQACNRLRRRFKAQSGGYFPGSLGNYAGHLGIPTLTAELQTSQPENAVSHWKHVQSWMETLIDFEINP